MREHTVYQVLCLRFVWGALVHYCKSVLIRTSLNRRNIVENLGAVFRKVYLRELAAQCRNDRNQRGDVELQRALLEGALHCVKHLLDLARKYLSVRSRQRPLLDDFYITPDLLLLSFKLS